MGKSGRAVRDVKHAEDSNSALGPSNVGDSVGPSPARSGDVASIVGKLVARQSPDGPGDLDPPDRHEGLECLPDEWLTAAVQSLFENIAKSDDSMDSRRALEKLERGDSSAAEAFFANILERHAKDGSEPSEAKAAARHLGAFAALRDPRAALQHYRKTVELDPNDPEGWHQLGQVLDHLGELNEAAEAYKQARALCVGEENCDIATLTLQNLVRIFVAGGETENAEDFIRQALALDQRLGRNADVAISLDFLGLVCQLRNDLDGAEAYHQQSLALAEQLEWKEAIASSLGNLARVHQARGDLDKAENCHQRSLALENELGRTVGIAISLGSLGRIHQKRGELDKAQECLEQALALNEALSRKAGMARLLGSLSRIYNARGDLDKADRFFWRSLMLDQEPGPA